MEYEEAGKVRTSVNIPIVNSEKKWITEGTEKRKTFVKSPNKDFVKMMEKKYPQKNTPLLIGCSDGKSYSIDALMALDEAGECYASVCITCVDGPSAGG